MSVLRVLREVADLLREEQRVSLRLIQSEYELTDDQLSMIVDELTNVRGEAVVDGAVLVARDAESLQHDEVADVEPGESLSPGDTEHRDLTVLFCDLVGSTEWSTKVDAEDFGETIRTYHEVVTTVVQNSGGHVANLMGDGLLVLFGYPVAHDDSARQAIRSALAAIDAMAQRQLGFDIRIGIHIGPVVISNIGPGGRSGALALGETVNVAARVESAAEPGTVFVTDHLAQVVEGWFDFESAGLHQFKGLEHPIEIHRVTGATGARSAIEARVSRGLSSLAGRDHELAAIDRAWDRARTGAGQVVALIGEPGIGKSRMVEEVRRSSGGTAVDWFAGRCSAYATATPLHAFADIAELGSIVSAPAPSHLGAEGHRKWMLASMLDRIVRRSTDQPLVVVVEDLHWADPTSIELIDLARVSVHDAPVMILLTSRTALPEHWHADHVVSLPLEVLDTAACAELVAGLPGASGLSQQSLEAILERAGGNPLYLEELTHTLVDSSDEEDGDAIPRSLQTPLLARLDGLGDAKPIAQAASVFGTHFTSSSLRDLLEPNRRAGLAGALDTMVAKGLVLSDPGDDSSYSFRHALIHEAAYHSLLKWRRRNLHGQILDQWEEGRESSRSLSVDVVAVHAAAAERYSDAVRLFAVAGEQAAGRSAHAEAAQHYRSALALLGELDGDTDRRELGLQRLLASTLVALLGYTHPETIATWQRTHVLATALADAREITASLLGLAITLYGAGDLGGASELIGSAMDGAHRSGDDAQLVVAFAERSVTAYFGGDFAGALTHGERATALYDPEQHHRRVVELVGDDSGVAATATSAWALMQAGRLDDAIERGLDAVALAESIEHPFSIAQAQLWRMLMHLDLGNIDIAEATDLVDFCDEQGFALWGGAARVVAAAITGDIEMHIEGRDRASATASLAMAPGILGIEADTHRLAGDLSEALRAVDDGLALSSALGLTFSDAKLLLQRAVLLADGAAGHAVQDAEIEALLRRSLDICDEQGSHWYALLIATHLAGHLVQHGRPADARRVLGARHARISGGDELRAVIAARSMLASLPHENTEVQT